MQHDLLGLKASLYQRTQNRLSAMSGFSMNGGSLSIHHLLWKEAAVQAVPLEENSLDTKSDAATENLQEILSVLGILCKQLLLLHSLNHICDPDK